MSPLLASPMLLRLPSGNSFYTPLGTFVGTLCKDQVYTALFQLEYTGRKNRCFA